MKMPAMPHLEWLWNYRIRDTHHDLLSGITLAAYAIPVSMAYASLAGLPVQYGIYGYLIGGLFYAFTGSCRQLSFGPTSAISLLIGSTLVTIAGGEINRWIDIASITALLIGLIALISWLLKLNSIVNFISGSVLTGFKAGAAITILLTQMPKLLGVTSGGAGFFDRLIKLIQHIPEVNSYVMLFGLFSIIFLVVGQKLFPGRPVAILLILVSIFLIPEVLYIDAGFATTGAVPYGLPGLKVPSLQPGELGDIVPLAFACFLLASIESISAARSLASQGGFDVDTRREFLALGVANIATAFFHGFPVSGGLSQSAVNSKAGARTPLSLVFASVAIGLCLLFFTGMLARLPEVVLVSILMVAVSGLIDVKEWIHLMRVSRLEFTVAVVAFASVLVLGILYGVVFAAVSSIVLLLRSASTPHVAVLGRIPGTRRYSDIERHPDNLLIPGVLLLRVEAPILYFNVENIHRRINEELAKEGRTIHTVIWDFSTSPYLDTAGAALVRHLYLELNSAGISFRIAEAHAEVRDILRAEEIELLMGHISRKVSIDDLVEINSEEG